METNQELMGRLAQAQDALAREVENDPKAMGEAKQSAEMIFSLARSAYSVGNYPQAEKLFFAMLFFAPSDLRAWLGYGGACESQEKWREALDGYAGAVGIAPDDPVAPFRAGNCFMALGLAENARLAFNLAVDAGDKVQGDPEKVPYARRAKSMLTMLDRA
ncbi:tetratricopeptide repeat protein [Desulfocurvus sp. DL9XJH121]